jgi:hypothetical protein
MDEREAAMELDIEREFKSSLYIWEVMLMPKHIF